MWHCIVMSRFGGNFWHCLQFWSSDWGKFTEQSWKTIKQIRQMSRSTTIYPILNVLEYALCMSLLSWFCDNIFFWKCFLSSIAWFRCRCCEILLLVDKWWMETLKENWRWYQVFNIKSSNLAIFSIFGHVVSVSGKDNWHKMET